MSYTQNFAMLRYGGAAWSGAEEWSCGLKLKHLGGDEMESLQDECVSSMSAVVAAVVAYFASGAQFGANIHLDWVSLNAINKDTGKYGYPNDANITEGLTPVGGTTGGIPQVAYCVTTRGNPSRGAGAFGRWYVPVGAPTCAATGLVSGTTTLAWANAAGTFLTALQNIDSGLGPDAWSPWHFGLSGTGSVAEKTGVDSAIVSVGCGNVLDTQRRRRNQLVETYAEATTW